MRMQRWEHGRITAICVVGVRQNKTTLDSFRLDAKLKDGNHGLSVTTKAQCTQEIRLGCSPKLCFQRMLLSLRLLEISSLSQSSVSLKNTVFSQSAGPHTPVNK